ncbi:MAG: Acyl-CoA thioesterase-like protein [Caulobacter sp.]|nr:Acyl-CoA thioesterase-like protein [Caulobacter sp.]
MGKLQDDTAIVREGDTLTANLSKDWEIWGPNGGYVASIALRAAGAVAPEGHRPASFSCQYLSVGAFGPATARVTPMKQGRSAWCLHVSLEQEGRAFLTAQVWTTNRTDGPEAAEAVMPAVPKPDDLKPIEHYLGTETPRHGFWQNFDSRPVQFFAAGEHDPRGALHEQWYRYRGFEPVDPFVDAARAVILVDTLLWPSHWRSRDPIPDYIAPSLDLSVWFHDAPNGAEWLMADAHADQAHAGLIGGLVRVWSEDGRLLARGGGQMLHTPRR